MTNPEIGKLLSNVQGMLDEFVKVHRQANRLQKTWTPNQEAQVDLMARAIADLKLAVTFLNEFSDSALNSLDKRVSHLEGRKF